MMSDFSGRVAPRARRAERFAEVVDGSTHRGATGREAALLDLVVDLRALPDAPAPAAAYSADLRARLMAEADAVLLPTERQLILTTGPEQSVRRRRRTTVAAAALVFVGSTSGLAVASQGTVQGDPLYGVKRGLETISTSASLSQADRGRDYLGQSRTRLSETADLLGDGQDLSPQTLDSVRDTLARFSSSAGDGSDLLFTGYQRDASADDVAAVRTFAAEAMRQVDEQAAQAPPQLQDAFADVAGLLRDLDQQARVLCAACGGREPLEMSDALSVASGGPALGELMDTRSAGSAAAASTAGTVAQPAATPSADPSPAPATDRPAQDGAVGRVGSTVRSLGETVTGSGGGGDATPERSRALVTLPTRQSGGPAVINMKRTSDEVRNTTKRARGAAKKVTGRASKTVKGVTDGVGETLKNGLGGTNR